MTDNGLRRRTVAEIQGKVTKQSKRNPAARLFHAKSDKDTIAAWRLELNRILHVFNVRSFSSSLPSLTVRFQTELAINTHVVVSNTYNLVSDIQHTIAKQQEEADGLSRPVSNRCALFIVEQLTNILVNQVQERFAI